MASIKLKHTSGNGTIIHSPAANPTNDVTLKLPSTSGSAGQVLKVASANHSATNAELEFGASNSTSGTDNFTIADGNLVIGTDGHGIDFSASSGSGDSELLDDYEEGTFTPSMVNSVTLHSGNDLLSYVKVGHMVTVTGVVRINSSNGGQEVSINNMPFATVNAADQAGNGIGSASLYDNDMPSGYTQVICVMNPNSTTLNVIVQRQSSNNSASLIAANNGYVGVSITYRAA
jgi:hypothetical protein